MGLNMAGTDMAGADMAGTDMGWETVIGLEIHAQLGHEVVGREPCASDLVEPFGERRQLC